MKSHMCNVIKCLNMKMKHTFTNISTGTLSFITTLGLIVENSKKNIFQNNSCVKGLETSPKPFSIFYKTPMRINLKHALILMLLNSYNKYLTKNHIPKIPIFKSWKLAIIRK